MIKRKVVAFRADASLIIGRGHVTRCLTLAKELKARGMNVIFICRDFIGGMEKDINIEGYTAYILPKKKRKSSYSEADPAHAHWLEVSWEEDAKDTIDVLEGEIDWLVVDHYGIDFRWHKKLRIKTKKIFVIDDIADRKLDCDIVLNQTYPYHIDTYHKLLPSVSQQLLGTRYALLRREFMDLRPSTLQRRKKQKKVERFLVVLGGGEQGRELTKSVLGNLVGCKRCDNISVDVVLAYSSDENKKIKKAFNGKSIKINWYENVNNISELMKNASISIASAGGTTWERICLGVPSFVIVTAEHQKKIANDLCDEGYEVCIGEYGNYSLDFLFGVCKGSFVDMELREINRLFKPNLHELVDGKGVRRVVNAMLSNCAN